MRTRRWTTGSAVCVVCALLAACASKEAPADDDADDDSADHDDDSADDDADDDAPAGDDDGSQPSQPEPEVLSNPEPEPEPMDAGTSPEVVVSFDGGDGGVAACGGDAVQASQKQVNLLLVLDQSGSMLEPGGDDADRWTLLTEATASTLEAVSDKMSLGLELFPHRVGTPIPSTCVEEGSCCDLPEAGEAIIVPVAPGTEATPQILSALSTAEPAGGTPTAAALALALDYFTNGDGKDLGGDRAILLVTDGGPMCDAELECEAETCTVNIDGDCPGGVDNCCDSSFEANYQCLDEDGPREQIEGLHAAGVRTAVMGIAGTAAYAEQLDAFARAGGLENPDGDTSYYAVAEAGGVEALEQTLTAITRQLVQTCVLELNDTPPDPDKVNVRIEGEFVPQEGDDGWTLEIGDSGLATVTLKGETCARVETEGVESITVLFGCPTVLRPPAGAR